MRKFLLLIIIVTCIISCQKGVEDITTEPGGGTNTGGDINGTWNFVSAHIESQNTSDVTVSGINARTVSFDNYTTENNTGSCVIDDSAFHFNGISYTISSSIPSYVYENGVLSDSLILPFDYAQAPADYIAPYTTINTDSIYFPQGTIPLANSSQQQQPLGGRYAVSNGTLTLTCSVHLDTTVINSGVVENISISGTQVFNFKK